MKISNYQTESNMRKFTQGNILINLEVINFNLKEEEGDDLDFDIYNLVDAVVSRWNKEVHNPFSKEYNKDYEKYAFRFALNSVDIPNNKAILYIEVLSSRYSNELLNDPHTLYSALIDKAVEFLSSILVSSNIDAIITVDDQCMIERDIYGPHGSNAEIHIMS